MKRYLIRFGIIAVLFLALDSVWLSQTQEILYRRHLAGILLDGFRVFPALVFYILYVAGIMVFALEPADRPYGIEALFRDDSGNWFSLNQHKRYGS